MKFLKKSIAFLLAMCMLLSYVPGTVFAASENGMNYVTEDGFYSILHLDAGRKYFSPEVVKKFIDDMADQGFNQLELYLADNQGFRLKLNTTSVTTEYGTYDLTGNIGKGVVTKWEGADAYYPSEEVPGYWDESQMEEIISYANSKGIEIVPTINMPGHMAALLQGRPSSWLVGNGTATTIDVNNPEAVAYALAVLELYTDYFEDQGIKYFSVGADEWCADVLGAQGAASAPKTQVSEFLNKCAAIIKSHGMTPRAFSDLFDSNGTVDHDFEVYDWQNKGQDLVNNYRVINTSDTWYWVVNNPGGYQHERDELGYVDVDANYTPVGAMMCIWCDQANKDGTDSGEGVYQRSRAAVQYFSNTLREQGYIIAEANYTLKVGETADVSFTLEGEYTAAQIAEQYGFGSILSASSISVTPGTGSGLASAQSTALTAGMMVLVGDANYYLTLDGTTLGTIARTDADAQNKAAVWTVESFSGNYTLKCGSYYLIEDSGYTDGTDLAVYSTAAKGWKLDGANLQGAYYGNQYITLQNGTPAATGTASGVGVYEYSEGTPASTTFNLTGAAVGSVTFTYSGTEYTFNVTSSEHTHDYSVAATCQKKASCSICGEEDPNSAVSDHTYTVPANCHASRTCGVCGVEDPNYGKNPDNHDGATEVRGAYDATTEAPGYNGDTYCTGCDTVLIYGTEIPKLEIHEHTGGVATCVDKPVCATCGEAYGEVNSANHTGDQVIKNISATYEGDTHCASCDGLIASGETIPNDPNAIYVTVPANDTADSTVDGQLGTNGDSGNTVNGLASYTVAISGTTSGGTGTGTYSAFDPTTLAVGSSKEVIFQAGTTSNYMASTGYNTTDINAAGKWTITRVESGYTISCNGTYINTVGQVVAGILNGTADSVFQWDGSCFYFTSGGYNYYLFANAEYTWWVWYSPVNKGTPMVEATSGGSSETVYTTTVTFTGGATNGNDTVTIDGQKFIVTVTGGNDPVIEGVTCEHEWELKYDSDGHWQYCEKCGSSSTKSDHSGGTATCLTLATCATCNQEYGSLADHVWNDEYLTDANGHWHTCTVEGCNATSTVENHTGGEATCKDQAVCSACGVSYGELDPTKHTWGSSYTGDATGHWHTCTNPDCGATSAVQAHSGGTATCQAPANCALCGQAYGTTNVNNHVGPMTEVEGTYVAPTDDTDGKEADKICDACGETVTGAVIPALNSNVVEITVATGETHQFVIQNKDATTLITQGDTGIASVAGVYDPGVADTPEVLPAPVTSIVSGSTYVFSDGSGNFMVSGNPPTNTTDAQSASGFIITETATAGVYTIQSASDGAYLYLPMWESGTIRTTSDASNSKWTYDSSTMSFSMTAKGTGDVDTQYVLSYTADSGWKGIVNGTPAKICTPGTPFEEGVDPKTTITFTGVTEGVTYANVDGIRYKINVVDAALMNAVLATPTWMTNREVSGFLNADGSASSFARQITAADHIAITTENGVALADIVPPEATTVDGSVTASHAIFWRGMRHATGEVQGKNGTDFHQHGSVVNYVRYLNGAWEGSADRSTWLPLAGYTLDLYYLQETAVTKEVITEVVDWGPDYDSFTSDQWESATYVLLDFAVALDGVGRHPALDGYPNNGDGSTTQNQKTIAFHCVNDTSDNKIYQDSTSGRYFRRIDSIFAEETGLYEVYMITVTRTSDTPTTTLGASYSPDLKNIGYSYDGTERIIWTIDEATFTEKYGQTTTDGNVLGAFDLRPAGFDITNKDAKSVMYRTVGGEPIVDYVHIYQNQGLLVTYYVRAKRTEDSLTVHYRVEGTDVDFHNYYIAVEHGHYFDDNFAASESHEGGLINNSVINFYGNTHTVNSDLTKLFDVPAQYRTGLYRFNHHVQLVLDDGSVIEDEDSLPSGRKIKEVILYYQVDNIHYVPIDYAHPVPITNAFFQHHVTEGGTVVNSYVTRYGASGPVDAYGYYDNGNDTYLLDTVMRGSGNAFTFAVEVDVPNSSGGTDRVTETHQVVIVPATTVDYDGFYLIQNSSGWTPTGSRNSTNNQQALCYRDEGGFNFGYDTIEADRLGPTNYGMTVTSTAAGSSLNFGFTGTGFDLRAHCATSYGQLMVLVRNADTNEIVRLSMVDTRIDSGSTQGATQYGFTASFNVPVISILGLPHGNYSVQVNHITNNVENVRPVTLTGFRVYNTMLSTDYATGGVAAGDIYTSEKDPTFVELRDVALAGVYVESSYAGHEDQLYADQIADNIMSQVHATGRETVQALVIGQYTSPNLATSEAVKVDIIDNGPKNEIYLWPGQTLAIGCNTTISAQIGMRSVDGAAVTFKLDGDQDVINTSTDMYYVVDGSDGYITVENAGTSGVLAVTTLKSLAVDYTPDFEPLSVFSVRNFLMARGFAASAPVKEGIVEEDGKKYYYVDGEKNYAGLIEIDGSYYYVRTSGEIVCGKSYWVTKTNGLVEAGFYTFDADGKMENCTIGLNGIAEENGVKYYYVDGVKTYAGLIEIDGSYYYVRSSGEIVCGKSYWVTKTNGLVEAGNYTFGADGKMENCTIGLTGIGVVDGKKYYFVDGVKTYGGLLEIDGEYYYARSSGEIVCGRSYWISKNNDLMPCGNYSFDAEGKMIR